MIEYDGFDYLKKTTDEKRVYSPLTESEKFDYVLLNVLATCRGIKKYYPLNTCKVIKKDNIELLHA